MKITKISTFICFFGLILCFACNQSDIEVIENRDNNQQLIEQFQQSKKNKTKVGFYKKFGANNVLIEDANFVNNKLEGKQNFYFPSGKLEITQQYIAGELNGKYQKYFENGKLAIEQEFIKGVMQGISTAWYENGNLKEKVTMRNNEENGPFTEYHENGNLKTEGTYLTPENEDFEGNKEHGELKIYDQNGKLEKIMLCELGICKTKK
jgi:antitoxin component YwqK of YwqJK toxin-antitoxin module